MDNNTNGEGKQEQQPPQGEEVTSSIFVMFNSYDEKTEVKDD
jgi:hypothetical protein